MIAPPRFRAGGPLFLVLLVVAGLAAPAFSVTEEEVEAARRAQQEAAAARAAALTDLNEAAAVYEALNSEYQALTSRIGQMSGRIDAYQERVRDLREGIRRRAVDAYIRGPEGVGPPELYISDRGQQALIAREVLARAVADQAAALSSLEAITAEMERLEVDLEAEQAHAGDLRIEAEAVAGRMYELLSAREAELAGATQELRDTEAALAEQRRLEEIEKQRRLSMEYRQSIIREGLANPAAGVADEATPGFRCPVAGATVYVDSWGAPRAAGRRHSGTDLMGAKGTPLVAVADGTIEQRTSTLGGYTVWLRADYGAAFFYAHLDSWAAGQGSGQWVAGGTVIGYMGDTGNAAPGGYHLHFSLYPNGYGTAPVNPYPTLIRHNC